jgi:hypothetical protein
MKNSSPPDSQSHGQQVKPPSHRAKIRTYTICQDGALKIQTRVAGDPHPQKSKSTNTVSVGWKALLEQWLGEAVTLDSLLSPSASPSPSTHLTETMPKKIKRAPEVHS